MRNFSNLNQFAQYLAQRSLQLAASYSALDMIGQLVRDRARAKIGTYQPAVGAFPGWPELADFTKRERVSLGFTENEPLLRTGELRDSIRYEVDASLRFVTIGSELDKALWNEVGTSIAPPRPFLGPAAFESRDDIRNIVGAAFVRGVTQGAQVRRNAPGRLGTWGRAAFFDVY